MVSRHYAHEDTTEYRAIGLVAHDRLLQLGAAGLNDCELLALVGGLTPAQVLSVYNAAGGLHGLTRLTVDDFRRIKGVGVKKAAQMLAAVELGRRTLLRTPPVREQFLTPRESAAYLLPQFGARAVEQFGLMLLDTKHRLIRTSVISVGTLDGCTAHPRDIFKEALAGHAAAIVLFHNHPSGDPTPSRDDVALTQRLVQSGELMGVDVIDHIVLAETKYFSFREAGQL